MEDRSIIRILFITLVAEIINFGILIPIVPLLFTEPSSSFFILPKGFTVDQGFILLGLLIGLYPLGQFISTPILGEISDVYGRKITLEVSIIGTVIASIIFGFGIMIENVFLLFASRLVNGLTGGLVSIAQATIADVTEKSERSKNFGLIGAAFGTGFILGPFLGGLLSSNISPVFKAYTPFFFAAGLSSLSLLYIHMRLKETSPKEDKHINWFKPFSQVKKGFRLPGLQKILSANFFYFSGFAFFTTFIPVFLVKEYGFSQLQTGIFFFYIGLLVIIGQTLLVRKVFDRFEEEKAAPITLFLTGLFIFLQPLSPKLSIFILLVTFFSFSNSLTTVSLNTIVSKKTSEKDQGLALGTNQSLRSLGNAFPSMLSGISAALFLASTPIYVAGVIIMLTGVAYKIL